MTVYVDNAFIKYRTMHVSHMVADTTQELYDIVDKIGVKREWIQKPGTPDEHFDISRQKRLLAIEAGAIPVTPKELVRIIQMKRKSRE